MAAHIEKEFLQGQEQIMDFFRQSQPEIITRSGHLRADSTQAILQKSDPKTMSADFVIVTRQQQANLHNNKVQITSSEVGKGLQTDFHQKSPVVLFEHGELPFPIGLSEQKGQYTVKLQDDKATARVVFSQRLPEAAVIFGLVDENILRMSSIGFLPDKVRRLSEKEMRVQQSQDGESDVLIVRSGGGLDIVQSLLLEWSITATGADTGAIKMVLDRGQVHGQKLSASLVPVFQKLSGPDTVWSPGWSQDPEPTEQEIIQAVEVLPDRVFQTIEKRSAGFLDSLSDKMDKLIRKKSGIID